MLGINRKFWCMQLHPNASEVADERTRECLEAGYIGLDFEHKLKDLRSETRESTPAETNERHYYDFYELMDIGDIVAVVLRNKPVALVKVIGEYKYTPNPPGKVGIWCSHYRKVEILSDYKDVAQKLPDSPLKASKAIQIVNPTSQQHYPFILEWFEMVG